VMWSQPLILLRLTPQFAEGHFFEIALTSSSDFWSPVFCNSSWSALAARCCLHVWPSWKETSHDRQWRVLHSWQLKMFPSPLA
jgi:hypothetical protein